MSEKTEYTREYLKKFLIKTFGYHFESLWCDPHGVFDTASADPGWTALYIEPPNNAADQKFACHMAVTSNRPTALLLPAASMYSEQLRRLAYRNQRSLASLIVYAETPLLSAHDELLTIFLFRLYSDIPDEIGGYKTTIVCTKSGLARLAEVAASQFRGNY